YIDNRLLGRNVINCLNLTKPDIYKPKLSYEKSGLEVKNSDRTIDFDSDKVEELYDELLLQQRNDQLPVSAEFELPVPIGSDMEIEKYQSVQHDFPEIYGIGEFGLPLEADAARKAKAKQLKAYLLPFEQLLGNYLKQIAHLPELFSYNKNIKETYATQPLYEVPEVAPLFRDISSKSHTWDGFKQDLQNTYRLAVKEGESENEYLDRRNRFLSHQIARFGESFHAYAVQMFSLHKDLLNTPQGIIQYQQKRTEVLHKLVDDKISFAEDYEQVSSHRYGAFDTTLYDRKTQLIGAYKLRLCRLLGIKTEEEQYLFGKGPQGTDLEGIQVLEHILLRPRNTSSVFLTVENRIDEDGKSFVYRADEDPYSFRLSLIMPAEAGRFKNKEFRKFAERLIRMETPAHILLDFKWMSSDCGARFEKAFIAWKGKIREMVPYYFQGADFYLKNADGTSPSQDFLPPSILTLQNQLVKALETPCKPKITVYNDDHTPIKDVNDVIRIISGEIDIHHIRVSESGGSLSVEQWIRDANTWSTRATGEEINTTYFAVSTALPAVKEGLIGYLGGKGLYKLTYTVGESTISKEIVVEEEVKKPRIMIGHGDTLLDYDFRRDGVFTRTTATIDNYFVQFEPGAGDIRIISDEKNIDELLESNGDDSTIQFQFVLDEYGPGSYEITYKLNNYTTSVAIEIIAAVKITISADDEQLEAGGDDVTVIPWNTENLTASFDYPGGLLKVYAIGESIMQDQGQSFSDGTIYKEDGMSTLYFEQQSSDIWQPGQQYDLVYSYDEEVTYRRIIFGTIDVEVEPSIRLQRGDEILPDGHEVSQGEMEQYFIFATPAGGRLVVKDSSDNILLEMETESDYTNLMAIPVETDKERIECTAIYTLDEQEDNPVEVSFAIIIPGANDVEVPTPSIRLQRGDEVLSDGHEVSQEEIEQHFLFATPAGGRLILRDGDDNVLLEMETESDYTNLMAIPADFTGDRLECTAEYTLEGQEDSPAQVTFSIIKTIVRAANTDIEIIHNKTGDMVESQNGVYTLVFNYQQADDAYRLLFSNSPGSINMIKNEESEYFSGIDSDHLELYGEMLSSGEYEVVYDPFNAEPVSFRLNIVNINPEFYISEVKKTEKSYLVSFVPLKAEGKSYVWRLNDEYVSQAKEPQLELEFIERDNNEVSLTIHLDEYERSFLMKITEEELMAKLDGK
ncbi:MAG: hypothetical protein WBA74_26790, partial [Cyclobacteriaceae bacterium]